MNVGTLNPLGALSLLVVRIQYFTNFVLNEIEEKHQNIHLVVLGKLMSPVTLVFVGG